MARKLAERREDHDRSHQARPGWRSPRRATTARVLGDTVTGAALPNPCSGTTAACLVNCMAGKPAPKPSPNCNTHQPVSPSPQAACRRATTAAGLATTRGAWREPTRRRGVRQQPAASGTAGQPGVEVIAPGRGDEPELLGRLLHAADAGRTPSNFTPRRGWGRLHQPTP